MIPTTNATPSAEGGLQAGLVLPLEQVPHGSEGVVVSVDVAKALRHRLAEMGLRAGVRLRVTGGGKGGAFLVAIGEMRLVLGRELGASVTLRMQD